MPQPETEVVRAGAGDPFEVGERVQLTDPKGRRHTVTLAAGTLFHTSKGAIAHDDLIGCTEGTVVNSSKSTAYLAQRPLLSDFVLSMPRGAAVIYPKDAALIVGLGDMYPGAAVVEAGVGSGALTCSLLRAVGPGGLVHSFEQRADFADVAERNVTTFFGTRPDNWTVTIGRFGVDDDSVADASVQRVVLDMLAPWDCVDAAARVLQPGGVLICYVATTTQLSRTVEALREAGTWTQPEAMETMLRTWHVEGLAVRPSHRMVGHTGFLVLTRRLADGQILPSRRSRPAKGAYGPDWVPGGTEPGGIGGQPANPR
jgi:tRNA (adenine57-N1/adenine58-N1)-methyltransferase catalytic subunit